MIAANTLCCEVTYDGSPRDAAVEPDIEDVLPPPVAGSLQPRPLQDLLEAEAPPEVGSGLPPHQLAVPLNELRRYERLSSLCESPSERTRGCRHLNEICWVRYLIDNRVQAAWSLFVTSNLTEY